jgi:hypothetical protein
MFICSLSIASFMKSVSHRRHVDVNIIIDCCCFWPINCETTAFEHEFWIIADFGFVEVNWWLSFAMKSSHNNLLSIQSLFDNYLLSYRAIFAELCNFICIVGEVRHCRLFVNDDDFVWCIIVSLTECNGVDWYGFISIALRLLVWK